MPKMALIFRLLTASLSCLFLLPPACAQTDFSVTTSGISKWDQNGWVLSTNSYLPGQYQSRLSLANGCALLPPSGTRCRRGNPLTRAGTSALHSRLLAHSLSWMSIRQIRRQKSPMAGRCSHKDLHSAPLAASTIFSPTVAGRIIHG